MLDATLSIDNKNIAAKAIKEGLVATQIGDAIDKARQEAIEAAIDIAH